jgi:hypothetical protein
MKSYLTTIFDTGSPVLTNYLACHQVGDKMDSPSSSQSWVITEVSQDDNIPPDPITGRSVTKVILEMEDN